MDPDALYFTTCTKFELLFMYKNLEHSVLSRKEVLDCICFGSILYSMRLVRYYMRGSWTCRPVRS